MRLVGNCRLNVRAEEDPKGAREAAVWYNALVVDRWCRVIKQKSLLGEYPLLNLNWLRS